MTNDTERGRQGKPMWKASRTARRRAHVKLRQKINGKERDNKKASKKRDGYKCRFPLCGCRALGMAIAARLESSHQKHKQMGGDRDGTRSTTDNLCTLCGHRHQWGAVSIAKGTLRPKFLTRHGYDGIIAWEIDLNAFAGIEHPYPMESRWWEIARETAIGVWAPFTAKQLARLMILGDMGA